MRKILLFALLAVCSMGANAQEIAPEEAAKRKKEINDIKRSEDFIYAEGFAEYLSDDGDKAITQAQKQSMDKLHTQVVMIFAQQLHMTPEDVEDIWNTIEDKCQNVEITVGDVTRTFKYIAKEFISEKVSGLFPDHKKKKEAKEAAKLAQAAETANTVAPATQPVAVTPEPAEQATEPVVAQVVEEEKAEPEVGTVPVTATDEEKKAEAEPQPVVEESKEETVVAQPVEEPKEETVTAPAEPVVETPKEEAPKKKETPVAPVKEEPVAAPVVVEEPVAAPAPIVKVEVPALCQTMLAKKDYTTLTRYLNEERAAGNLIFSTKANVMARIAECYIVIIDKATRGIVTVLDKGVNDRMNFVTGKMDDFVNYQLDGGYGAVYVQIL